MLYHLVSLKKEIPHKMSSLHIHIPFTQVCVWISYVPDYSKPCMYKFVVFCVCTFRKLGIECPCQKVHSRRFRLINHTPFFLPGAGGSRTVTIEELKERTKVTDSQLTRKLKKLTFGIWQLTLTMWRPTLLCWG